MKEVQLNLFGSKRIEFDECVKLTIESLKTYGQMHDHWAIAWSGGKDSTTLLTLIVSLIASGQIEAPKSLQVFYADTRMEIPPLWIAAKGIIKRLKELNINIEIVMAPLDDRFLVYILGRGVPPPSNTFRWCTGQLKVEPMITALQKLYDQTGQKILMLTGVRQGESAIRDGRIAMSCGKDGAECGQGWYQTGLDSDICSTLAPILHWRVCVVWEWLKYNAPQKAYGQFPTVILADAYGGDEAEEINARTGCIGCPLVEEDTSLKTVIKMDEWSYLKPLLGLKKIYREMRKPQYRLRKDGEFKKDGSLSKNQQRLGPLDVFARIDFLNQILDIQYEVNEAAERLGRPEIDILNEDEYWRILKLIEDRTFPNGWTGDEVKGDVILDKKYADGSVMETMFK